MKAECRTRNISSAAGSSKQRKTRCCLFLEECRTEAGLCESSATAQLAPTMCCRQKPLSHPRSDSEEFPGGSNHIPSEEHRHSVLPNVLHLHLTWGNRHPIVAPRPPGALRLHPLHDLKKAERHGGIGKLHLRWRDHRAPPQPSLWKVHFEPLGWRRLCEANGRSSGLDNSWT